MNYCSRNYSSQNARSGFLTKIFGTLASVTLVIELGATTWWVWTDRAQYRSLDRAKTLLWENVYAGGSETLYCGVPFNRKLDLGSENSVEHVVPKADLNRLCLIPGWSCSSYSRAASDLHNLWPELGYVNRARSNHPFAEIPGEKHRLNLARCPDFEREKAATGAHVEPRDDVKGDVARTILYMQQHYRMQFHTSQQMLLRWHRFDPPNEVERQRNNIIARLQKTRNPYIDGLALNP